MAKKRALGRSTRVGRKPGQVTPVGPLAPAVLEDLRQWVVDEGYSAGSVPQVVSTAVRLSAWMQSHRVWLEGLSVEVLDRFVGALKPGTPGRPMVLCRMPTIRRFLTVRGLLRAPELATAVVTMADLELDEWGAWQRGISDRCIATRRRWVGGFVESICDDATARWDDVDVAALNGYVTERGRGYSPASCSYLVDAMRSLLRWALATGRIDQDLTRGILGVRSTRQGLPRGLTPGQLDALLAAANPATMVGMRDRAVVITLSRLGLRAGEAADLMLDDIDWAAGRISVVGKRQRRLTLPLPVDVGDALVAWLRVRPTSARDRAVFVRSRAPINALTSAGISDIIVHLAARAGLGVMHAHRLRHTAAMNVIAAGGSLIEARELLGHERTDSTHIYARTDLASLKALVVPFGQVPR
ncbi:MAG: tyrosine-type recombinase/integrase [Acidimicrobiales bacterium]